MIRLLLDMGVPRRAADALVAAGFDAVHIAALGRPRDADEEIIAFARNERRVVVTVDSDFARILASSQATSPSVMHLRMQRLGHAECTAIIREVAASIAGDLASGCIATVSHAGVRVRRLPIR